MWIRVKEVLVHKLTQFCTLAFLHGAILSLILVLASMASYEDTLFDEIVAGTVNDKMTDEEKALSLLHRTHALLKPRNQLFTGRPFTSIRETLFRSADVQLNDAKANCGSFAHVLGRLLQRAGIEIRIAQMRCGKTWGCHIVIEANVNGKFVVLDPYYDLAFRKSDGSLASFQEVRLGWPEFRKLVPANYDPTYRYEEVRYTNWEKIPFLMPLARKTLNVFLGKKTNSISIRSNLLNIYRFYEYTFLFLEALVTFLTGYLVYRRRATSNTPLETETH